MSNNPKVYFDAKLLSEDLAHVTAAMDLLRGVALGREGSSDDAWSAYLGLMAVGATYKMMLGKFPALPVELVGEREVSA